MLFGYVLSNGSGAVDGFMLIMIPHSLEDVKGYAK
jgi:hypothetical protein